LITPAATLYALYVEPGTELAFQAEFTERNSGLPCKALIPQYVKLNRKAGSFYEARYPLFKGLVFLDYAGEDDLSAKPFIAKLRAEGKLKGVIRLDERDEATVRHFLEGEGVVPVVPVYADPARGWKITVCEGPLRGFENCIYKVYPRKKEIFFLLKLMGQVYKIALSYSEERGQDFRLMTGELHEAGYYDMNKDEAGTKYLASPTVTGLDAGAFWEHEFGLAASSRDFLGRHVRRAAFRDGSASAWDVDHIFPAGLADNVDNWQIVNVETKREKEAGGPNPVFIAGKVKYQAKQTARLKASDKVMPYPYKKNGKKYAIIIAHDQNNIPE
jgi:transcription antitermination factor NusG